MPKSVNKRIGEQNQMSNGQMATIISWISNRNIGIRFEDGTIRTGVRYNHFQSGRVSPISPTDMGNARIGEKHRQSDGHTCEIVGYKNSHNCKIKYDNGVVKEGKCYRDIKLGLCPLSRNHTSEKQEENYKRQRAENGLEHVGKEIVNNNDQVMKITAYNSYDDITVEFEDGTIVSGQRMDQFRERRIVNPNFRMNYRVSRNEYALLFYLRKFGFDHYNRVDGVGELDCYNPEWNIGIEYDGYYHKYHADNDYKKNKKARDNNITLIRIRDENCPTLYDSSVDFHFNSNKTCLNKDYEAALKKVVMYINKAGFLLECDVDFERDKEEILLNFSKEFCNKRIGETRTMRCGMQATITKYRLSTDIDVLFENGKVAKHKTYAHFKEGCIAYA